MSDYLSHLESRPKGSAFPRQASPLYCWFRENFDRLHRLRADGKANWSDIMRAAIEAGVLSDETERSYKRCRDVWYRVNKLRRCQVEAAPIARIKAQPLPPSRTERNWRPEAIEQHYANQDDDKPLTAASYPVQVRPEENEHLPERSRESARRAWKKIQARKV